MEKIIWTLWWQGEREAPAVIRNCIDSMRTYANGAKVIVLDQESVNDYIRIPVRILELVERGNISITHLSDLIRFQLLEQYGGLWLDSTIYVTQDIPASIFEREFYTIKNGAGGDYKNIAKERWSVFLIGGTAGNLIFSYVNRMLAQYWENNDELIGYFLVDFCLNEIYERLREARELIDAVPDYEGNVFETSGVFQKLDRRAMENRGKLHKIRSLARHLREFFCVRRWKKWGIRVAFLTLLQKCTRTNDHALGMKITDSYNAILAEYCSGIGKQAGIHG
jgi:hypothetical protein